MRFRGTWSGGLTWRFAVIATLLFFIAGIGCQQRQGPDSLTALTGLWSHQPNNGGATVRLRIFDGGTYELSKDDLMTKFQGMIDLSGNTIRFVDFYCGHKLPGVYSFAIKGAPPHRTMELVRLDDKYCMRGELFPGVWRWEGKP